MKINMRLLSPEPEVSGSAAAGEPKQAFSGWKEDGVNNDVIEDNPGDYQQQEEFVVNDDDDSPPEGGKPAEGETEKGAAGSGEAEDGKPAEGAEKGKGDETVDTGEDTPITITAEDINLEVPPGEEAETVDSFIGIGQELGLEVKEDSFEAFKESVDAKIEEARNTPVNVREEFGEDGLVLFQALRSGRTLEQIQRPLLRFDEIKAMDDKSKVILYYTSVENLSKEEAELKYDDMLSEDQGEITTLARSIDSEMDKLRKQEYDRIVNTAAQVGKRAQAAVQQEETNFDRSVSAEIAKRTKHLDVDIDSKVIEGIVKQVERGDFRKAFKSNPKLFADAILHVTLTNAVFAKKASGAKKEGKAEVLTQLAGKEAAMTQTRKVGESATKKSSDNDGAFRSWGKPAKKVD